MRLNRSSLIAAFLLLLGLPGCYSAVRVEPSSIEPGGDFSLYLTEQGVRHLEELSTRTGDELTGQLQSLTADSITISTRLTEPSARGIEDARIRQSLTFALDDVRDVTVPELNKGRTAAIVVAAAVVVGFAVKGILGFGATDTTTPTPPDGGIPLFSLFSVPW